MYRLVSVVLLWLLLFSGCQKKESEKSVTHSSSSAISKSVTSNAHSSISSNLKLSKSDNETGSNTTNKGIEKKDTDKTLKEKESKGK